MRACTKGICASRRLRQGWKDDEAPVLWPEWSKDGLRIRSEVFAHVPGGGDVKTGNQPLFLWLRLRVHEAAPARAQAVQDFDLILQSPHVSTDMTMWNNVHFTPAQARYPRPLKVEGGDADPAKRLRILEDDSHVRLAIAPGESQELVFSAATGEQPWHRLHVRLPAREGAHMDVLLPMISAERPVLDDELSLGYEAALAQTCRYWNEITACSTRFEVPEQAINDCIRQSVRFSNLLTEKNPVTGKYCKVNGSWT